jgi:hypothetical protein
MSKWVWTDEPSDGWCGCFDTREAAVEEGRLATGESFQVAEVEDLDDDEAPLTFLRMETIEPLRSQEKP